MKKLRQFIAGIAVLAGVLAAVPAAPVLAINVFDQCDGQADSEVCAAQDDDDATNMVEVVVNTLIFILGIVSVIMIVVGGIRLTTSGGDSSGVKAGRETIIYSVAGLVVAILSFAIVNFVLGRL